MWKGLSVRDVCRVPEGPRYSRFSGASKASALSERQNTPKLRASNLPAVARGLEAGHTALQTGGSISSAQLTGNPLSSHYWDTKRVD